MVEFKGYLTGNAEKYFYKKSRTLGRIILIISILLVCPIFIVYGVKSQNWLIVKICCYSVVAIMLLTFMPKSKKERKAFTPNKIFIQEDCIICVADKYSDTKFIEDVKKVIDYGEFYYLIFPIGNVSEKYVCQKDLLTKGTLEDFESFFEGKIERKPIREQFSD